MPCQKSVLSAALLVYFMFGVSRSENEEFYPPNPCPDIFQYTYDPRGGLITLPFNGSEHIRMEVNVTVHGVYDLEDNGMQITLLTHPDGLKGKKIEKLKYQLLFPEGIVTPRVTRISLNGNDFCYGPPENPPATHMWAAYQL